MVRGMSQGRIDYVDRTDAVRALDRTASAERRRLEAVRREGVEVACRARQPVFRAGDRFGHLVLIETGWIVLHESRASGERQILDFRGPGSILLPFLDEHEPMRWSAEWLTPGRAIVVPPYTMKRLCEDSRDFLEWRLALREAELRRAYDALLNIGRRPGRQRMAHLLARLHHQALKAANGHAVSDAPLPVRQQDIADALGFTNVYVNQLIRRLREEDVLGLQGRGLSVIDPAALYALGEYTPETPANRTEPPRSARPA